ncbi:MAG: NlpC/P60 family protein [Candidatus Thorarchaeota archaeon]|jgi:cell wall-associated NlpC family hydrolase
MIRDEIVAHAGAQVGKPYAHQGWGPKVYDCIGLVVSTWRECGVFHYNLASEQDPNMRCYGAEAKPALLLSALKKYFVQIPKADVLLGDAILFRSPKLQHLGIVVGLETNKIFCVHADSTPGYRKVRRQQVRKNSRAVWGWRPRNLHNG